MNIVYCFSPDWVQHIPVCIYSLVKNNPGSHNVYLLSSNLNHDQTYLLSQTEKMGVNIEYFNIDLSVFSRPIKGRFTSYTMLRLLIPELLPVTRCLYLDADTLVTGDLYDLWFMDMNENFIGGVKDTGFSPYQKKQIHFPQHMPYVNAGVLLMDLHLLRQAKLQNLWIQMANSRDWPCNDQDIINKTCSPRIDLVSKMYNSSTSTGFHPSPRIVHFAGPKTPWVDTLPLGNLWGEYRTEYEERFQ